jgi:transcriptional regulator with XRE-family HTH domain
VRVLRHFKKISQEALAERSGMSRSFITRIESGHFSITLETLAALAEALDSSPTQLLGPSERLSKPNEAMNRPHL